MALQKISSLKAGKTAICLMLLIINIHFLDENESIC